MKHDTYPHWPELRDGLKMTPTWRKDLAQRLFDRLMFGGLDAVKATAIACEVTGCMPDVLNAIESAARLREIGEPGLLWGKTKLAQLAAESRIAAESRNIDGAVIRFYIRKAGEQPIRMDGLRGDFPQRFRVALYVANGDFYISCGSPATKARKKKG